MIFTKTKGMVRARLLLAIKRHIIIFNLERQRPMLAKKRHNDFHQNKRNGENETFETEREREKV